MMDPATFDVDIDPPLVYSGRPPVIDRTRSEFQDMSPHLHTIGTLVWMSHGFALAFPYPKVSSQLKKTVLRACSKFISNCQLEKRT